MVEGVCWEDLLGSLVGVDVWHAWDGVFVFSFSLERSVTEIR